MASVKDVLSTSGSLPFSQLKLRSSQNAAEVEATIKTMADKGLVDILSGKARNQNNPISEDATIRLTTKGIQSFF